MKKILSLFLVSVIATSGAVILLQPGATQGASDSKNFSVTQSVGATIQVSVPTSAVDLGNLLAGNSTFSSDQTIKVVTNDSNGYSLSVGAGRVPALTLNGNDPANEGESFADYSATTTSDWVAANASESLFGFTVGGSAISAKLDSQFRGDGNNCGVGSFEYVDYITGGGLESCWRGFTGTTSVPVGTATTYTSSTGDDYTVKFGSEIGADKHQVSGNYNATITFTATTNS